MMNEHDAQRLMNRMANATLALALVLSLLLHWHGL